MVVGGGDDVIGVDVECCDHLPAMGWDALMAWSEGRVKELVFSMVRVVNCCRAGLGRELSVHCAMWFLKW